MRTNRQVFHSSIKTYDSAVDGDSLLVIHEDLPCVCRIDTNSFDVQIEKWIPSFKGQNIRLFYSFIFDNNRVYVIPGEAGVLGYANLLSGEEKYIEYKVDDELRREGLFNDERDPFFKGFAYRDNIYILGSSYPGLIKTDRDLNKIDYMNVLSLCLEYGSDYNAQNYFFTNGFVIHDGYALLPMGVIPAIAILGLENDTFHVKKLTDDIKMVHGIGEYKDRLLIIAEDIYSRLLLVEWNENDGICDKMVIDRIDMDSCKQPLWWDPIVMDDDIFIFPMNRGCVYKINFEEKTSCVCNEIMNEIDEWPDFTRRYMIIPIGIINNKIMFHTLWDRRWHMYDSAKGTADGFICRIDDKEYECRWWEHYGKKKGVLYEDRYPLDEFIEHI